jgi:hypothetical protein
LIPPCIGERDMSREKYNRERKMRRERNDDTIGEQYNY